MSQVTFHPTGGRYETHHLVLWSQWFLPVVQGYLKMVVFHFKGRTRGFYRKMYLTELDAFF